MYAVGGMSLLTSRMAGWEIEIANDNRLDEPAVIKRIDLDINCALVAFESGKKEWLDLTLSAFKVVVQPAPPSGLASGNEQVDEGADTAQDDGRTALLSVPDERGSVGSVTDAPLVGEAAVVDHADAVTRATDRPVHTPPASNSFTVAQDVLPAIASRAPPTTVVASFDWYAEGGHVELCDPGGAFLEGAVLCSKTDTHVQLYNEMRQFFEIHTRAQSFKVVIHGLLSLKRVPMGQTVEVYSAITGGFYVGTVLKAAEVGKLTPIRSAGGAVDWLDLSTQTFKLVFLSVEGDVDAEYGSPTRTPRSPTTHRAHKHGHHPRAATSLESPVLAIGQRVEIFESASRLFAKFSVVAVREQTDPLEYEFELQAGASNPHIMDRIYVGSLANLRCRIPLQPHMWSAYRSVLPGHRVDIYDKTAKTVLNAKILDVGSPESGHSMLVRFKDGKKSWIHSHDVKLKLRLSGEPLDVLARSDGQEDNFSGQLDMFADYTSTSNGDAELMRTKDAMWERPAEPTFEAPSPLHDDATPRLSRHYSDVASLIAESQARARTLEANPRFVHSASAGDILASRSIAIDAVQMTQTIPPIVQPLDFSSLRTLGPATEVRGIPAETVASSSRRSRKSDSTAMSSRGTPFSLADVWREDREAESGAGAYVHLASGVRQPELPEWLERRDSSTGKLFVIHTSTRTLYSLPSDTATVGASALIPSSNSPNSSELESPAASLEPAADSGGRVVVPVGAIEAVRVYNMLGGQE